MIIGTVFHKFLPIAVVCCVMFAHSFSASAEIFDKENPIVGRLPVLEMSAVFSDVLGKLDEISWGGKNVAAIIESIENISPKAKVAVTDRRIVVLSGDTIIGNWQRPKNSDWDGFGQIAVAIILKLREVNPELAKKSDVELERLAIGEMVKSIDSRGRYIHSQKEETENDPHVLTSLGIAGVRDTNGNYVINTVIKGTQAETSGLVNGNTLISINGVLLKDLSDMEVLGLFNGFSSGTLKIKAVGADKQEKSVTLRRAAVIVADADVILMKDENGAAVLELVIHKVSEDSAQIVADSLDRYNGKIKSVYLDLRGASGDDEISMAKMAGLFLGQVPVARISAVSSEETELTPGGDAITKLPVVIAVSNTTSGTAEGLAFAFYENKVGATIGVPTAGKVRLMSRLPLDKGGMLEVYNREMKSGTGRTIDGRGFFPLVCLSNIRTSKQEDLFLVNVRNHAWVSRDFNNDATVDINTIKNSCPNIKSGVDEDAVASAVAMDLLIDSDVYNKIRG